ncbi:MAG: DUF1059 domain-containing protein [Deltaproteobacteria bacterium]|nr:DUF1059 domain-containing protein [Deltaproteobacteria bacterium]
MKKMSCREFLPRDCEWEIVGDDDNEVVRRAQAHCESIHSYRFTPDDEGRLRSLIRAR